MYGKLNKKELSIIHLISRGFTNEEIGKNLNLAKSSVAVYIWHLCNQYDARNRIELVNKLKERGLA